MRKKRRKQLSGRLIILASSIIMVNLLGVGYANWNDNFNMTASMSTGSIEPFFIWDGIETIEGCEESMDVEALDANGLVENVENRIARKSSGRITARVIDDNTLEIKGWCYPNFSKRILVGFGNSGSVPITCSSVESYEEDEIVQEIQYTDSNIEIGINVGSADDGEEVEYGDHSFTYQLQFEQKIR